VGRAVAGSEQPGDARLGCRLPEFRAPTLPASSLRSFVYVTVSLRPPFLRGSGRHLRAARLNATVVVTRCDLHARYGVAVQSNVPFRPNKETLERRFYLIEAA